MKLESTYFFSRPVSEYTKQSLEIRKVNCYEMELIIESAGGMYIDNVFYKVKKGDVVFRYPGQTTQGILPYSCYTIRFSWEDSTFNQIAQKYIPAVTNTISTPIKNGIIDIFNESIDSNQLSNYFFTMQLSRIIYMLVQEFHPHTKKEVNEQSLSSAYVIEAVSYIQTNWRNVKIDDLIFRTGISRAYLMRIFKKEMKRTVQQYYIDEVKIKRIKNELIYSNDDLLTLALNVGFKSQSYFSNYFTHHTGMSPRAFRNLYRR